jgi:hypothetical protein
VRIDVEERRTVGEGFASARWLSCGRLGGGTLKPVQIITWLKRVGTYAGYAYNGQIIILFSQAPFSWCYRTLIRESDHVRQSISTRSS